MAPSAASKARAALRKRLPGVNVDSDEESEVSSSAASVNEEETGAASSSAARDEEVWMHYFFVFVCNFFVVFISL